VRASVVGTISAPGHFCLFFPDDVMTGDRLSGRYCALQTIDQSERAANNLRQSVENATARDESLPDGPPRDEFAALYWFTGD
jgi:hypothetical protein